MMTEEFTPRTTIPEYFYITKDGSLINKENRKNIKGRGIRKIRNKNLKICFGISSNDRTFYSYTRYYKGSLVTYSYVFLIINNEKIPISVVLDNFFKILHFCESKDNIFQVTFSLSLDEDNINLESILNYIVPENSEECKNKKQYDSIYNNGSKFTSDFKPGYLYISRSKKLLICFQKNVNLYQKRLGRDDFFTGYSENPIQIKTLIQYSRYFKLRLEEEFNGNIFDLVSGTTYHLKFYSKNYTGKEIGKIFDIPENYEIELSSGKTGRFLGSNDNYRQLFINTPEKLRNYPEKCKEILGSLLSGHLYNSDKSRFLQYYPNLKSLLDGVGL